MKSILAVFVVALFISREAHAGGVTIADIIENVKRNEALYENHDVRLKTEYEMGDFEAAKIRQTPDGPVVSEEIIANSTSTHYVSQDGLFRLDRMGTTKAPSAILSADRTRAFDGKTTRLYDQDAIGNIIPGREVDDDFIYPHTLLFRDSIKVPLATLLAGDEALKAHPLGKWQEGYHKECAYMGDEVVDGLRCHKLWFTEMTKSSGEYVANNRWELWLAEERNYIPVRMRAFTFRYAKDIPAGEGFVSDFREIEAGVWFPFHAEAIINDPHLLMFEHKSKVRGRYHYFVEEASLHPAYERSFFETVIFPPGTAVYELENRKIKKSYRVGSPGSSAEPARETTGRWWLIGVAVAAMAIAVVVACWRRRGSPLAQARD